LPALTSRRPAAITRVRSDAGEGENKFPSAMPPPSVTLLRGDVAADAQGRSLKEWIAFKDAAACSDAAGCGSEGSFAR